MTSATRAPWVGLDLEDNRYHVLCLLGEGGMASIFKAIDRKNNKEIVLKVPKPALLADPEFTHRFKREIRTLVELKHPSVVAVYGFGRHDGVPFAVLEFLSGGTLGDQPKPCQHKELGAWLPDVAAALDHVHKSGYVHRDVKPGNILFDLNGRSRLADFGIIKSINEKANQQTMALTESGVTVGTPEYMAPELAKGHSFDGRVDQYALAVTVYERLSGRRPIEGGTGPVILVKQIREKPKPLDEVAEVTPELAEAVGRALAKDPKNRYSSCFEFARAVMNPGKYALANNKAPSSTKNLATLRTPLAYDATTDRASWVLPAAIGGGVFALLLFGLLGWLMLKPGAAPATPFVTKPPIEGPADLVPNFRFKTPDAVRTLLGKPTTVTVNIERGSGWHGPVSLKVQPLDGVAPAPDVCIAASESSGHVTFQLTATATAKVLRITGAADGISEYLEIPLDVRSPQFTVSSLTDVNLEPNKEQVITVKIARDGWDDAVLLKIDPPKGIDCPNILTFAPGVNEARMRIRCAGGANSGPLQLLFGNEAKASFKISIVELGKTKTIAPEVVGAMIATLPSDIVNIVFHPKDARTVVAWDQSHFSVYDVETKTRSANPTIAGTPTHGTFSPTGKQVLTAVKGKILTHSLQGNSVGSGNSFRYKILGLFYDNTKADIPARVWTPNDVCDKTGQSVRRTDQGATLLKYSTFGNLAWLASYGNKVKLWGKTDLTFELRPTDFAISHDGRWVAIAANAKVLLYDTDIKANPPTAMWEKEVPGITAVGVSTDGKMLAIGVGRELRVLKVNVSE